MKAAISMADIGCAYCWTNVEDQGQFQEDLCAVTDVTKLVVP